MKQNRETRMTYGGMSLFGVSFLILLILKLFNLVTISWWWVFSPIIAEIAIALIVVLIVAIFSD